jgi:DNA polymerase-3 subunit gamma/tau
MVARLQYICDQEGIEAEPAALALVARQATGSLRDALSLLDQLRVYSEKTITLQSVRDMLGAGGSEEVADFVDALLAKDLAGGLRRINAILEEGLDLRQFNRQMVEHLRDLMLLKSGAASAENTLLDVTDDAKARLTKQAEGVTLAELLHFVKVFGEADTALRSTVYGQLPLEMAFVAATLKPQEAALPDLSERNAQISAGTGRSAMPQRVPESHPAPVAPPPPPINAQLGVIAGNGRQPVAAEGDNLVMPSGESEPPPDPAVVPEHIGPDADLAAGVTIEPDEPDARAVVPQSSSGELSKLEESWETVVAQINARSKQMAAAFRDPNQVRPVSASNGICTISFLHTFHAEKSGKSPHREIIETAVSRVLGREYLVESITFAEAESGVRNSDASSQERSNRRNTTREKPSPYDTSRGKAAINIFGIDKFEDPQ